MLDAFLEDAAAKPFRDGERDCALQTADWVRVVTGIETAAHLRGRYSTALGRERLLRRLGGLKAVMTDCAARAGLRSTANPVRGDVGLIDLPGGMTVSGICLGERWSVASSQGQFVSRAVVRKAWSVPHA